eukprot:scaffold25646_cov93-Isochrysis_galbana.AAC.2
MRSLVDGCAAVRDALKDDALPRQAGAIPGNRPISLKAAPRPYEQICTKTMPFSAKHMLFWGTAKTNLEQP